VRPDVLVPVESARKWLVLAERRRSYFVDLYRSGRWTRHYDEETLKQHMIEVIADVERWQQVVGGRADRPQAHNLQQANGSA
jgi:hypothetical protein